MPYWYQRVYSNAPRQIKIIFASDMHSSIHKWAKVETFLKESNKIAKDDPEQETWLIYGGDYVKGEGDFDLRDKGEINYKIMSQADNIVAAGIGNHDFDEHCVDPNDMAKKYDLPLTTANVRNISDGSYFYPAYVIRQYNDKSFLFLSFVDDGPNNAPSFSTSRFIEKATTAYKDITAAIYMDHKVDQVILIDHLGEDDIKKLTKLTRYIDFQFAAHQHITRVEEHSNKYDEPVYTIYGSYRNNSVQKIEIKYDEATGRYLHAPGSYENISVKNFKEDPNTEDLINKFVEGTPLPEKYSHLDETVSIYRSSNKKERFSSARSYLRDVTLVNAPLPDLVNDAFRAMVDGDPEPGPNDASVSFVNADGLRKDIKQRPKLGYAIRGMDIYNTMPFENYLCYAYMTGEEIAELSNMVIHHFSLSRRGYFSGLEGINTKDHFKAERIWDPYLNKYAMLDPVKRYKVVFNDFYAQEHPGFKGFLEKNNILYYKTNIIDHEAVISYIKHLESTDPNWIDKYQKAPNEPVVTDLPGPPQITGTEIEQAKSILEGQSTKNDVESNIKLLVKYLKYAKENDLANTAAVIRSYLNDYKDYLSKEDKTLLNSIRNENYINVATPTFNEPAFRNKIRAYAEVNLSEVDNYSTEKLVELCLKKLVQAINDRWEYYQKLVPDIITSEEIELLVKDYGLLNYLKDRMSTFTVGTEVWRVNLFSIETLIGIFSADTESILVTLELKYFVENEKTKDPIYKETYDQKEYPERFKIMEDVFEEIKQ
jgi:2',3'-cyclic-nucleotide 2'-phosphodiesterase (5'-nucleotidase family)